MHTSVLIKVEHILVLYMVNIYLFANAILIRRLDRIKTVIQLHVQINMMQDH